MIFSLFIDLSYSDSQLKLRLLSVPVLCKHLTDAGFRANRIRAFSTFRTSSIFFLYYIRLKCMTADGTFINIMLFRFHIVTSLICLHPIAAKSTSSFSASYTRCIGSPTTLK